MRINDWSSDVFSSDLLPLSHLSPLSPREKARPPRGRILPLPRDGVALQGRGRSTTKSSKILENMGSHRFSRSGQGGGVLWRFRITSIFRRSEEHTSELQSLMRLSYPVF